MTHTMPYATTNATHCYCWCNLVLVLLVVITGNVGRVIISDFFIC